MKKKSKYQTGGATVSPVTAPVMQHANLTPLIQVASTPIDEGSRVGLQVRQQNIMRDRMDMMRDQFEWRKEAFEYQKQQDSLNNAIQMIKLTSTLGAPTGAKSGSGVATNFHTTHQHQVDYKMRQEAAELKRQFAENFENYDSKNPSMLVGKYFETASKIENLYTKKRAKAVAQATKYQKQMDLYEKDSDKYDDYLYASKAQQYLSSDLNYNENLLYVDTKKLVADYWKENKTSMWANASQEGVMTNAHVTASLEHYLNNNIDANKTYMEYYKLQKSAVQQKLESGEELTADEEKMATMSFNEYKKMSTKQKLLP